MGFLKKIKRQISLKNISPIAKVGSIVKKPVKQVIKTGKVGIKDVLKVTPIGVGLGLAEQGKSQIADITMGNEAEIIQEPQVIEEPKVDDTKNAEDKDVPKKENNVPVKEKSKLPLYIGVGVGSLVLIGAIFYFVKRK